MFDLEQSIADWRKQMLAAGIKSPVPLEELEIHLREEIERQIKAGLNEQEAFEISIRQIGQPKTLNNEFKKNKGAFKRTMIICWLSNSAIFFLALARHHQGTSGSEVLNSAAIINTLIAISMTIYLFISVFKKRKA